MKIAVCGSSGKMGNSVIKVSKEQGHDVVCLIDAGDDVEQLLKSSTDVCIDFSSPSGTVELCKAAAKFGISVVTGTTGITGQNLQQIQESSKKIPILMSSNFSIGVHVLRKLVEEAAKNLPKTFDIEIVEKHHSQKKDSPSGTAMSLLHDIEKCRETSREIFGRNGLSQRENGEICVHAVRGGNIVGEHEVYFLGQSETVEISHRATNREIFARGALFAAEKFYSFRKPGIYAFADII